MPLGDRPLLLDRLGPVIRDILGVQRRNDAAGQRVSRAKLIVPVRDAGAVHAAQPDFSALWRLCSRLDTTGAYVSRPTQTATRLTW
jgi:predicted PhzF superfamily epimerase YddE/YHI9